MLIKLFPLCLEFCRTYSILFLSYYASIGNSCIDSPNQRVVSITEYYMGDRAAAEYVLEFLKHWLSRKYERKQKLPTPLSALKSSKTNASTQNCSIDAYSHTFLNMKNVSRHQFQSERTRHLSMEPKQS